MSDVATIRHIATRLRIFMRRAIRSLKAMIRPKVGDGVISTTKKSIYPIKRRSWGRFHVMYELPAGYKLFYDPFVVRQRAMTNDGIKAIGGADEPIVEIERQFNARVFLKKEFSAAPKCKMPKLTGAEIRNGPAN